MPKIVWKDTFYVQSYELARSGLTNPKIAEALGVSNGIFRKWLEKRPALVHALKRARRTRHNSNTTTFRDYVYGRLPEHLQKLWDKLSQCETQKNGIRRIQALLESQGKDARQHLFLYAITASNFNFSDACRKVNLPRKTVESWIKTDPDFAQLLDEIHLAKKDFFEGALVESVRAGDTAAIIFANKTLNRDRGYNDKQEVEFKGTLDVNHTVVPIDDLLPNLSIEAKREILQIMRKQKSPIIEGKIAHSPHTAKESA